MFLYFSPLIVYCAQWWKAVFLLVRHLNWFQFCIYWQAGDWRPFWVICVCKHLLGVACWSRLRHSSVSAALVTLPLLLLMLLLLIIVMLINSYIYMDCLSNSTIIAWLKRRPTEKLVTFFLNFLTHQAVCIVSSQRLMAVEISIDLETHYDRHM